MTIKLGIVGTGYIAKHHARAALALSGLELSAVVNHRPESMATFAAEFKVPHRYNTIEALLQDGGVDAVSINTPNYLHAPQTIAALGHEVHVMVEKPMAMNAAEAETMVKAAEKSGTVLMVAHCWRFENEVLWLRQQISEGRIGPIIRSKGYGVHVRWGPDGWFKQRKFAGGGALADMGIHAIDTVRFLMGDPMPTSVYARVGAYYDDADVDDTGVVIVNWTNGAVSYIESGWWQPHADGIEASTQLYGGRGYARLFPTHLALLNKDNSSVELIDPGFPEVRDPHCPQSMYDAQMAHFVSCIRSGRTPVPGGVEGWINVKIIDAAYASARTGEVIAF